MDMVFKVWSSDRAIKKYIILEDQDQLCLRLVARASEKLKINGSTLVIESDGTIIEDDEVLKLLKNETLMLLSKDESWKPHKDDVSFSSLCSTETAIESPLSSRSLSPLQSESINENGHKVSEATWEEFQIPWNQLNQSAIKDCENGTRTHDCVSKVVTITVDGVREIKQFISTKTFKTLARKIVNKYPKQFQDVDEDGVVIGDGCHSLTSKLIDRNNYLNRPHKRPSNSIKMDIPPSKRKRMSVAKAGCLNWQPQNETQNPETLEEKKNSLNSCTNTNFDFNEEIKKLLTDTYAMQRLFLNAEHSINEIKEEWPVLLIKETIFWHFEKLMNQNISELTAMFIQKEDNIFKLGISNKFTNVTSIPSNEDLRHKTCLKIIADFFNENIELLIKEVKEDQIEEIKPDINAPCIIIKHNSAITEYFIYVEKEILDTVKCENFMEAFGVMFSLYYNLNMQYPKTVSNTLEFIQRYMMKINPDQGSKAKKKNLTRIISLINKLRQISQ